MSPAADRAFTTSETPSRRLRLQISLVEPVFGLACARVFRHLRIRELLPEYLIDVHAIIRSTTSLMETGIRRAEELVGMERSRVIRDTYILYEPWNYEVGQTNQGERAVNTWGISLFAPLPVFDRNQGEKARTELDMRRSEKLRDATRAQVFSDVDSAYATLESNLALLRPYKAKYLQTAVKVRDTVSFAYQHGGASLLDFLNAQNDYRSIQLNYLNLVGSYLTAASQLNLAVGREVIQ